jgi:hypothetical protein
MKIAAFLTLMIFNLFKCSAGSDDTPVAKILVQSGEYERFETPVSLSVETITNINELELQLFEMVEGVYEPVDIQFSTGDEIRMHWILSGITKPGEERVFELRSGSKSARSKTMNIERREGSFVMYSGDKPVLQYNSGTVYPPEGTDSVYRRSGFIHPLYAPDGTVLTEIQPPDHLHHYGLWNPWTNTSFREEEVDFWNLAKNQGTVRFGGLGLVNEGAVFGSIQVVHQHVAWPASSRETIAMNELQEIRVFNRSDGSFLVEISSRLSPAEKIVLEEYRYGGFVLRATAEWTNKNTDFFTSRGLDRDQADGQRAEWCVLTGETRKGTAGILMMGHPSNYNHPEPLRVWPSDANRQRGDHFINFSPTRNTRWILEPGINYLLRYRLLAFDGEMDASEAERVWKDFSNPPLVSWEKHQGFANEFAY